MLGSCPSRGSPGCLGDEPASACGALCRPCQGAGAQGRVAGGSDSQAGWPGAWDVGRKAVGGWGPPVCANEVLLGHSAAHSATSSVRWPAEPMASTSRPSAHEASELCSTCGAWTAGAPESPGQLGKKSHPMPSVRWWTSPPGGWLLPFAAAPRSATPRSLSSTLGTGQKSWGN